MLAPRPAPAAAATHQHSSTSYPRPAPPDKARDRRQTPQAGAPKRPPAAVLFALRRVNMSCVTSGVRGDPSYLEHANCRDKVTETNTALLHARGSGFLLESLWPTRSPGTGTSEMGRIYPMRPSHLRWRRESGLYLYLSGLACTRVSTWRLCVLACCSQLVRFERPGRSGSHCQFESRRHIYGIHGVFGDTLIRQDIFHFVRRAPSKSMRLEDARPTHGPGSKKLILVGKIQNSF